MDYSIIDKYVYMLMEKSTPGKPYWNIELIRQNKEAKWNYIDGCMNTSLLQLYKITGDDNIYNFVKTYIDHYVDENGNVKTYELEKYSTDDVAEGRVLFDLYDISKEEKYRKAIENIYQQFKTHPRTKEGNFWHKGIYPNQVWLDGLYMAQPFYLQYETKYNGMKNYNDIINQFKNVRKIMFDEKKGLYYHGYDSSRKMFWADKNTGLSKNFWLRSIGWFTVALADCSEIINEQMYDEYRTLTSLLKEIINSILKYQDPKTKMFYQVVDKGGEKGNYVETSGSAMIAYSILKAARMKILPERYYQIGLDIFNGICENMLKVEKDGSISLNGICLVAGLGPENNTRRDGSYEYYISEPVVSNDAKGVGAFIMAYIEVKKYLDSLK